MLITQIKAYPSWPLVALLPTRTPGARQNFSHMISPRAMALLVYRFSLVLLPVIILCIVGAVNYPPFSRESVHWIIPLHFLLVDPNVNSWRPFKALPSLLEYFAEKVLVRIIVSSSEVSNLMIREYKPLLWPIYYTVLV